MLFTVIIPAFNVGAHIEKTLTSLENQTLNSGLFEVIIVNDGSTDNTAAVVSRIISRGIINIKLFNQQNLGVSSARNRGITEAIGQYIYFLDGDDYIALNFLSLLSDAIRDKAPQLLITSCAKVVDGDIIRAFPLEKSLQSADEIKISYLKGAVYLHLCACAFRRKDILNWNLSFETNTRFGEDLEFYQNFLFSSTQIATVNLAYFYYVIRPDSAMNKSVGLQREDALRALRRVQDNLSNLDCSSEILASFQGHFFPDHILKVIYRLILEGGLGNAIYIATKYNKILKSARLDGRRLQKAKMASFSPRLYVLLIFAISKLRK